MNFIHTRYLFEPALRCCGAFPVKYLWFVRARGVSGDAVGDVSVKIVLVKPLARRLALTTMCARIGSIFMVCATGRKYHSRIGKLLQPQPRSANRNRIYVPHYHIPDTLSFCFCQACGCPTPVAAVARSLWLWLHFPCGSETGPSSNLML